MSATTQDKLADLLISGSFGKLLKMNAESMTISLESMPDQQIKLINENILGQLAGVEQVNKGLLASATKRGNFIHRTLSIQKYLLILISYIEEFEKLENLIGSNCSEKLERKISYYYHDLFVLNERLKKLTYDASFLLRKGIPSETVWIPSKKGDSGQYGKPANGIVAILQPFHKSVRFERNKIQHDWDYESDDLRRLSLLEIFLKLRQKGHDSLEEEYSNLVIKLARESVKAATINARAAIKITNELATHLIARLDFPNK